MEFDFRVQQSWHHGSRIEPPEKSSWPLVLERKIFFPLCERSRRTLGATSMSREKGLRVGWPKVSCEEWMEVLP